MRDRNSKGRVCKCACARAIPKINICARNLYPKSLLIIFAIFIHEIGFARVRLLWRHDSAIFEIIHEFICLVTLNVIFFIKKR